MSAKATTDWGLVRRLLGQARPYWLHVIGLLGLSLLATPLQLLSPLPLRIAIDNVIGGQPLAGDLGTTLSAGPLGGEAAVLALAAALLIAVSLLTKIQALGEWLLRTYVGERLVLDFRAQLFRHVQRLTLARHDLRGTTDSTYRIQYDAPAIQWVATDGIIQATSAAVMLVSLLVVTALIDWQLAVVALGVVPLLALLTRSYRGPLRGQWRDVKQLESAAMGVVQEVLGAVRVVKAFGQEDREQARFVDRARQGVGARLRVVVAESGYSLLTALVTALGAAAVLVIGTRQVLAGVITLGELLMVTAYLSQLYGPLQTLIGMPARMQASLASAERSFALLDEPTDVIEQPDAQPLTRATGAVAFEAVSFTYGDDRPVLTDITFAVPPGARVGIIGTSGAGKTTLVSLLTRFYDPSAGAIRLDGIDLRDYQLADLRQQFAIVLQEPVLFSASIAENIAYARPGASAAAIEAAALTAGAHDFIAALPQGYDTLVGERGMRLSGGERQRIALARAFLKDAPILILDEPTSSVDTRTESLIMAAMERLMAGRTTFMIAHRLSTVEGCDVLLTIEGGRLTRVEAPSVGTIPVQANRQTVAVGGRHHGD